MPRGVEQGRESVRAFMDRQTFGVGMFAVDNRYFGGGETIVVEGLTELRYVDSGGLADAFRGAAVYRVREGHVRRITFFDDLVGALAAGGLPAGSQPAAAD